MAMWTREIKSLRVKLEWDGGDEVIVKSEDLVLDVYRTNNGSNDPAAIGYLMNLVEEDLHSYCDEA